jgi:hypothetical protein
VLERTRSSDLGRSGRNGARARFFGNEANFVNGGQTSATGLKEVTGFGRRRRRVGSEGSNPTSRFGAWEAGSNP